ncbi:MAG: hypothetical protein WAP03_29875 [Methylorubrum rhodinum]|uniref:hypothetical protein n=1 Tax=Methylorubrum rhodinum TaxID=29428 RepID=UPI003BAE4E21
MRFRRRPRPEPYEDTSRKRAAYLRKQHLERKALPLFAAVIAERQITADEEMIHRAVRWDEAQAATRRQRAGAWHRARARLFAFDAPTRLVIRDLWRTCPYPADPSYLADLLHQIGLGRIDPHRPPWRSPQPLRPTTTPDPARFDAAFRQIGQRKIGGGPKTVPADEFLFVGNLGSGILFLTSRVRPCAPNESFHTSSNHRLRDSHVGRAGHWVEITVRGECSDADLALIERLARAADTRPILVRRASDSSTSISSSKSMIYGFHG